MAGRLKGAQALPNEPLFQRMLENATARPNNIVMADQTLGVEADHVQLFLDLLHMRHVLAAEPHSDAPSDNPPSITVLMSGNYHFIVTMLAILAGGASVAAINLGHTAEYTVELMGVCGSSCIVYDRGQEGFALEVQQLASASGRGIRILAFEPSPAPRPSHFSHLRLHLDTTTPPPPIDTPALLLFSSGTTSTHAKCVVHSRRFFNRPYTDPYRTLPPGGVILLLNDPLRMISWLSLVTTVLHGGCRLRIIDQFTAGARVWEELRAGPILTLAFPPVIWEDVTWHYKNVICQKSTEKREAYLHGARSVILPLIAGTKAPPSLMRFWREELERPLFNAYGSTEMGGLALAAGRDTKSIHPNCIGQPPPYIQAKLSEGDRGEVLIKSPIVMLGYASNPELTKSVFDNDGFYRTGDLAHLDENGEYIYDRRIKTTSKDIPLVTENTLSRSPYLQDVVAVALPFPVEYRPFLIGVLVRVIPTPSSGDATACTRRLRDTLYRLCVTFDCKVTFVVRIVPPQDQELYSREEAQAWFPYDTDPAFMPELEFPIYRGRNLKGA